MHGNVVRLMFLLVLMMSCMCIACNPETCNECLAACKLAHRNDTSSLPCQWTCAAVSHCPMFCYSPMLSQRSRPRLARPTECLPNQRLVLPIGDKGCPLQLFDVCTWKDNSWQASVRNVKYVQLSTEIYVTNHASAHEAIREAIWKWIDHFPDWQQSCF